METTLREMGELLRNRPGPAAPSQEVAAWYEHKAELLDRIALESSAWSPQSRQVAEWAELAREHARRVRDSRAA